MAEINRVTFYLYLKEQLIKKKGPRLHLPFKEAKSVLNQWHNIPDKLTVAILKEMDKLKLIKIEGKFNHMKITIRNSNKPNIINDYSNLYHSLGMF